MIVFMVMFRLVRTALLVAFVALIITTRTTQSYQYWWVAVVVTALAMAPDFLEWSRRKQAESPTVG